MTHDNQVVMVSTTTHGCLYVVYHKDDVERKKILYTGELSENSKHAYCECTGWSLLKKCYHQKVANNIMEVKIV